MTKLVAVVAGEAFGVYVDLRVGLADATASSRRSTLVPGVQVLVPAGVANGFQALVDGTQYVYCFDHEWQPDMPGLACNPLDPALADRLAVADRSRRSLAGVGQGRRRATIRRAWRWRPP